MLVSYLLKIQLYIRHWALRLNRLFKRRKFTAKARLGQAGETEAANYLAHKKGFKILVRNWRHQMDELDLVALDPNGMLVFIEVRTRSEATLEESYRSITPRKKKALKRACLAYLRNLTKPPSSYRFDVVVIQVFRPSNYTVHHFENIPLFIPSRPVKNPYA